MRPGPDDAEEEAGCFERLVHTGSLDYDLGQHEFVRWIWDTTAKEVALGTQRRISVEFKSCGWGDLIGAGASGGDVALGDSDTLEGAKQLRLALGRLWRDSGRQLLDKDGEEAPK